MYRNIYLKRGKEESLRRFHPWIFSGAIQRSDEGIAEGDIVRVLSSDGMFLAVGHYQIGSISVRVLSFRDITIDHEFWTSRLASALEVRRSLGIAGLLQAVTLLPLLLIACICWQPLLVHGATAWAAADTLLRGDEASMPALLPLLYFVCATLGISFTALIGTLRTYALGLYCKDRTTGNGAA